MYLNFQCPIELRRLGRMRWVYFKDLGKARPVIDHFSSDSERCVNKRGNGATVIELGSSLNLINAYRNLALE